MDILTSLIHIFSFLWTFKILNIIITIIIWRIWNQ